MDDVDASLLIGAGVESPAENVSRLVARTILQVFIDAQVHAPYDAKLRLVIPSSWRLTASSRSYLTSRNQHRHPVSYIAPPLPASKDRR